MLFRSVVPMGDAEAAARRVVHWLGDPGASRARGREGREFVRRFDHREVARRELTALEEAIQRRRRAGGGNGDADFDLRGGQAA